MISDATQKLLLEVLGGFRNGAAYGAKIRAPHALVMTALFRRDSLLNMARSIANLTYQHSKNLAMFAFLYKALSRLLRKVHGGKSYVYYAIAGFVGGYIIWGKNNPVNSQINMYLLSRILFGLAKELGAAGWAPVNDQVFPIFAGCIWMFVMTMFEMDRTRANLQPSLVSSMDYIYHESDKFKSIADFFQQPGVALPIVAFILSHVFWDLMAIKIAAVACIAFLAICQIAVLSAAVCTQTVWYRYQTGYIDIQQPGVVENMMNATEVNFSWDMVRSKYILYATVNAEIDLPDMNYRDYNTPNISQIMSICGILAILSLVFAGSFATMIPRFRSMWILDFPNNVLRTLFIILTVLQILLAAGSFVALFGLPKAIKTDQPDYCAQFNCKTLYRSSFSAQSATFVGTVIKDNGSPRECWWLVLSAVIMGLFALIMDFLMWRPPQLRKMYTIDPVLDGGHTLSSDLIMARSPFPYEQPQLKTILPVSYSKAGYMNHAVFYDPNSFPAVNSSGIVLTPDIGRSAPLHTSPFRASPPHSYVRSPAQRAPSPLHSVIPPASTTFIFPPFVNPYTGEHLC